MHGREAIRLMMVCAMTWSSSCQVCLKWGLSTATCLGAISKLALRWVGSKAETSLPEVTPCYAVTATAMSCAPMVCQAQGWAGYKLCLLLSSLSLAREEGLASSLSKDCQRGQLLAPGPQRGILEPGLNPGLPSSKATLCSPQQQSLAHLHGWDLGFNSKTALSHCMIFGKLPNLSGLHVCCCEHERLAEGDCKELKDVEVPRVGERAPGSREWYKGYSKSTSGKRESLCLAVTRLCLMELWIFPRHRA